MVRRACVLDRKYRFYISELPDLSFQNQNFPQTLLFWNIFSIIKCRFSIRKLSALRFQNRFLGHAQKSYFRMYSAKDRWNVLLPRAAAAWRTNSNLITTSYMYEHNKLETPTQWDLRRNASGYFIIKRILRLTKQRNVMTQNGTQQSNPQIRLGNSLSSFRIRRMFLEHSILDMEHCHIGSGIQGLKNHNYWILLWPFEIEITGNKKSIENPVGNDSGNNKMDDIRSWKLTARKRLFVDGKLEIRPVSNFQNDKFAWKCVSALTAFQNNYIMLLLW